MKIKHIYYGTYVLQVVMAANIAMAAWAMSQASATWALSMGAFSMGLSTWVILRGWNQRVCIRTLREYFRDQGMDYWNT